MEYKDYLAIYCAGGLGREILDLVVVEGVGRWGEILFVDDVTEETEVNGCRVIRWEQAEEYRGKIEFLIANGEPYVREALYNKIKGAGYPLATFVSKAAFVGTYAAIGEGSIIYDCGISAGAKIGVNTLVNTRAIVGHDVVVGNHCMLAANVFCGGNAKIGNRCYLAPGVMLKDKVRIGDDVIAGLGSIVLRNVKEQAIVFGNPAKIVGDNTEHSVFGTFE